MWLTGVRAQDSHPYGLSLTLYSFMVLNMGFSAGHNSSDHTLYFDTCRITPDVHWNPDGYLEPDAFEAYACSTCYKHMDNSLFPNGTKLVWQGFWLYDENTKQYVQPDYQNESSPVFETLRTKRLQRLWTDCCEAAVQCCRTMRTTPPTTDVSVCPRTWDGWNCWQDTLPETTIYERCPSYIYFHSDKPHCSRYASKECLPNGTWYKNSKGNEYSDYMTCGQEREIKILLNTHIWTFGLSAVFLLPALGIFFYYRQLKVHRILMHKNLFISLLFTAIFVIVFESYFMMDYIKNPRDSVVGTNLVSCKLFYTMTKYFRLTAYTWMFCEGFYLHRLIVAAFAEQKSMLVFHLVGWGFPVIPITIWATVRKIYADDLCWTVPAGYFEWILFTPMLVALMANFCFLLHIIQVLITKLRSSHADEPKQFRRAVRATMVLIPLFGLHFLLLSYHPRPKDCHFQQVYTIITYAMDGLQGGIVSVIFCYFNNEVLSLIKRSYNRQKMIRDLDSHTNSRRTRESRASTSTNVDSIVHDCNALVSKAVRL